MTKFRATLATFACASALALSGATAAAAATFSELQGISTEIKVVEIDELPPAPKLAAPSPTPAPSAPLIIRKKIDIATPVIQQAKPPAPGGTLKTIKSK